MYTYINELMPRELLPTVEQQTARIAAQQGLEVKNVYAIEDRDSYWERIRSRQKKRVWPTVPPLLELVALNIAIKLANTAFSRYANGNDAIADRRIPRVVTCERVDNDTFANFVQKYASKLVKPGTTLCVMHDGIRISLRVAPVEPVITKSELPDWVRIAV